MGTKNLGQYRVHTVNSWNGWDPLKQVVLGNCPPPELFEDVKDHKLRDLLQKLLYETREDLDNLQTTLEDVGIDVVRLPENARSADDLDSPIREYDSLENYADKKNGDAIKGLPKPCLNPRDDFIVLGDKILVTTPFYDLNKKWANGQKIFDPSCIDFRLPTMFTESDRHELGPFKPSKEYADQKFGLMSNGMSYTSLHGTDTSPYVNEINFKRYRYHTHYFWAPSLTRIGEKMIADLKDVSNLDQVIGNLYPNIKCDTTAIGGHNDGSYCLPKPGLVICSPWVDAEHYKKTLPGWDVLQIDIDGRQQRAREYKNWEKIKKKTRGAWWIPDAENNTNLVNFVEDWLSNWVGYCEETLFEVNMLSIDTKTILSMNYQKDVHRKLKAHGIEPIYVKFRHRNFWDGGLHCLTLDTLREGSQQNYFGGKK